MPGRTPDAHPAAVRIVHDWLVRHEEADDIGQLARVAEVDRVGGALQHHQQYVVVGPAGDLLDPGRTWHQRIPVTQHDQRRDPQLQQPGERQVLGERAEHPYRAGHAEPQVIRHRHRHEPVGSRMPSRANCWTARGIGWLCKPPAGETSTAWSSRSG
jgi:hypothetical protein